MMDWCETRFFCEFMGLSSRLILKIEGEGCKTEWNDRSAVVLGCDVHDCCDIIIISLRKFTQERRRAER